MSANRQDSSAVLNDQYRCPAGYDVFKSRASLPSTPGFFRFGSNAVCYGRNVAGSEASVMGENNVLLPFDAGEVIDNLRFERYMARNKSRMWSLIQKPYYWIRPLMPVAVRKHFQRVYLNSWRNIPFPDWPVDRSVEKIYEQLVLLSLQSKRETEMPFVWFWPNGYSGCLILTHDIETSIGRDDSPELADIDASYGMKSSFQIVPEESYEVPATFLDALRARNCEINLHGLTHDGQLFRDRKRFLHDAKEINRYAREYKAAGFRSPVLYRNLDWFDAFEFSYDMTVPNVAHLDPQRGGCSTVLPYFIGEILELPLTMTQDYSLFHILKDNSIDLWRQQIDLVLEKHGLISFNIHPDYVMSDPYRGIYAELLSHLRAVCEARNVWIALPGEVDQWWRERRKLQIAFEQGAPYIEGPSSGRAVIAYAQEAAGRIAYDVPSHRHAAA